MSSSIGWRVDQYYEHPELFPNPNFQVTINYGGSGSSALNANLAANGEDRVQIRFSDASAGWTTGKLGIWINPTWNPYTPTDSGFGPSLKAVAGGGIVEIPFSLLGVNVSDVDRFAMGGMTMNPDNYFAMRSISSVGPPLRGDFDRDGDVDDNDRTELVRTFGRRTEQGFLSTDDNQDGVVDGSDFLAWQRSYVAEGGTAAVPEPAVALLVLAVVIVAGRPWFAR